MNNSALIAVVVIAFIAVSFANQNSSNGSIGDVKYSVLKPADFIDDNPGWVLMDGRAYEDSDYARITGKNRIPDAQNQFIRGMAKNYEKLGIESRIAGDVQKFSTAMPDNFKIKTGSWKHNHDFKDAYYSETYKQNRGKVFTQDKDKLYGSGDTDKNNSRFYENSETDYEGSEIKVTVTGGAKETRPTNIALYTYIKINN